SGPPESGPTEECETANDERNAGEVTAVTLRSDSRHGAARDDVRECQCGGVINAHRCSRKANSDRKHFVCDRLLPRRSCGVALRAGNRAALRIESACVSREAADELRIRDA